MEDATESHTIEVKDTKFAEARATRPTWKWRIVITEYVATALFLIGPFMCCALVSAGQETAQDLLYNFAKSLLVVHLLFRTAHLNPAVTIVAMITGDTGMKQGFYNIIAQTLGSFTSASFVQVLYGKRFGSEFMCNIIHFNELGQFAGMSEQDLMDETFLHKAFAQIYLGDCFGTAIAELLATSIFVLTVYKLTIDTRAILIIDRILMAIIVSTVYYFGLVLTYAHDTGSLNPARSLGPALVNGCHWIYAKIMNQEHKHSALQAQLEGRLETAQTAISNNTLYIGGEEMFQVWDSLLFVMIGTISAAFVVGLFARWTKRHPGTARDQ